MATTKKTKICYRDRLTGKITAERIFAEDLLRWLYEDTLGFTVFNCFLNNQAFCWLFGKLQDLPSSRRKIFEFVKEYSINLEEVEFPLEYYQNFNAFFSRHLKSHARPFIKNADIFCSPGDGKVLVYPKLTKQTQIPVKGSAITVEALLASESAAQTYQDGSALILRLAPRDYHRFHFPDQGKANRARYIRGTYHSVNPIALSRVPGILYQNKRAVTEFYSQNFGRITYVEIGATTVASIIQTYTPGIVDRGQEKGYFQYGGSTIVLLFEPGAIIFDEDLIQDSQQHLEVQVQAGNQLGTKISH
ncbi:MAG: phosphatidylserine decarboxylase [Leptolyngbya sp. SIO3F4]|nr:phosphatidylserine decarboxylase [Leptolyngbya sp. SIO3F4]